MLYRLFYNSETAQIFLVFNQEFLNQYRQHSKSIELSCIARMDKALREKDIDGYNYHGYMLKSLMREYRHDSSRFSERDQLYLTLAEGYLKPKVFQLRRRLLSSKVVLEKFAVTAAAAKSWDNGEFQLCFYVSYCCRLLKITPRQAHYAHLQAMIIRSLHGNSIKVPKASRHERYWFKEREAYHIDLDEAAGIVVLQIDDLETTLTTYTIQDLYRHVRSEITSLDPDYLVVDQQSFESELHLIYHDKVARFLKHPMSILIAYVCDSENHTMFNESRRITFSKNHKWSREMLHDQNPEMGRVVGYRVDDHRPIELIHKHPAEKAFASMNIKIVVDETRLTGKISGFDQNWYASKRIDEHWLQEQLAVLGFTDKTRYQFNAIMEAMDAGQNLDGLVALEGVAASPYRKAYLNVDKPLSRSAEFALVTAQVDEVIAVVAYDAPGEDGIDIYGKVIVAHREPIKDLMLGDVGVLLPDGRVVAKKSGLAKVSRSSVVVENLLEFKGDINAATGQVFFKGSIVIEGSVEAGALVKASGNVEIKGSVAGGIVISGGDIKVAGGIIAAKGALIKAKGDLSAEFIENSKVIVKKNVYVNKAIMNCELYVGESIELSDANACLAGGKAVFRQHLKVANLGRPGASTVLRPGDQYLLCLRADILQHREDLLVAHRAELMKSHGTAKAEKDFTEKKRMRFGKVLGDLERIDLLLSRIAKRKESISESRDANRDAMMEVKSTLSSNLKIFTDTEEIVPVADYTKVRFVMRQSKGTHFISLQNDDDSKSGEKEKPKKTDKA